MYYSEKRSNSIVIHEASGAPYFEVSLYGTVSNYNLSGNILSISYSDGNGRVEVYDVHERRRLR